MEIDMEEWMKKITAPYDTEAKLIEVQGKYLKAMEERLEEMHFMLEGINPNAVLSDQYIDVLREHIELALKGVAFGEEEAHRNGK